MDVRLARITKVREALARGDLDALMVTSLPNIRYLTGFSGSNALLLVTAKDCVLFTDFRYATQVETEVTSAATVRIESTSLWNGLWVMLAALPTIDRIGFESSHLLHRDFQRLLEQGGRWQWRPVNDMVEAFRMVKDPGEVALIERAVEIAETALAATLPRIYAGQSETEIAGLLEQQLRIAGSESYPFSTIVASGPQSALPHARAGDRRVSAGELLLLDFGAVHNGYCSDITRTFVVGRANDEQREIFGIVLEANARASGALRAGMQGMAADAVAREYIDAFGFGEAFGHSLGHGIGLEVHEAPRLAKTVDAPLPLGAVVTIEPGIYRPGWGGVRIEDDVLITASGPRILTSFARDLHELT